MIKNEAFRLTAENKKDNLEIRADKLLFIESADNYAQIFYREKNLRTHCCVAVYLDLKGK